MKPPARPAAVKVAIGALLFVGVTALGGGAEMILFPHGNRYVRAEWLDGIPVLSTWILPGIVLAGVFGFGSLITAFGLFRRPRWRWVSPVWSTDHWSRTATVVIGAGLVVWILLELVLIPHRSIIELVYGATGLMLTFLPFRRSMRGYLNTGTPRPDQVRR